ncbi:MAG TPA: mechanosensitive ion channel domain-containing protein [Geobacteraceae bacterium]
MDSISGFLQLEARDNPALYWLKEVVVAVVIFLGFWLLSRLLRYFLTSWAPRFTAFTKSDLDDRILTRVTPPATLVVVFAGAYYALGFLPFPERVHVAVSGATFVAMMVIFTNIGYRATDEMLKWYAGHLTQRHGEGLDRQVVPLLEKLITIFLVGTALIITFKHFGYDILSLVTALGIGSLAIGLAAKDTLANMISGFTLMIDRPFRIGDRIQLKEGHWGDVSDIGLRTTKIKTVDNTLLIIPNSDLCNSTVVNMAFPDVRAKGRVNVGVGYGSDVEAVKTLLVAIALDVPEVLREPPPEAYFISFGDSALNMALFFWVDDYTRVFPITDKINTLIIRRFREAGIDIPYPTRTLHLEKDTGIWPTELK